MSPTIYSSAGLATVFLVAVLLLQDAVLRAAIVVAVASSTFIIFVVPDSVAATPRTDTEHRPAAGTALGLVVHGRSVSAAVFILASVIFISIVRLVLRRRLVNLL